MYLRSRCRSYFVQSTFSCLAHTHRTLCPRFSERKLTLGGHDLPGPQASLAALFTHPAATGCRAGHMPSVCSILSLPAVPASPEGEAVCSGSSSPLCLLPRILGFLNTLMPCRAGAGVAWEGSPARGQRLEEGRLGKSGYADK